MEPLIHPGKRATLLLTALSFSFFTAYAQSPSASGSCLTSATPTQVRAEGLAERFGAVVFQCSNFVPSSTVTGNITLFLPVSVTNRIDSNNNATDVVLAADTGAGLTPTQFAGNVMGASITFRGVTVTVPASGQFTLQISNVRGDAYQIGGVPGQQINALISAPFPINQSSVTVASAQTGLYSTQNSAGIYCVGSPLPSALSMSGFFGANTAFASTRLTEGFGSAFQPAGPGDTNGTRFLIGYSGFPSGASLYVPTFIAGSDAQIPTAGGDLGVSQNPGAYVPGSHTLLTAFVQFADSTGASGYVSTFNGNMNQVSQVTLTHGSGYAVYEVVDAKPNVIESAQFPTFIAISSVTAPAVASETVSFAPVSTVMTASASAPIPRFEGATTPPNDCTILGDCSAGYFPKLSAVTAGLNLTATAGKNSTNGYIAVDNVAGGTLNWSASTLYNQGSGWLTLAPSSGQNNGTILVNANTQGLAAGTYTATITVTGGPLAGSANFPLTLTVAAATTSSGAGSSSGSGTGTGSGTGSGSTGTTSNAVTVSSVVNAASFASAPLVAGSLTTLMGSNLAGKNVSVTFDGAPATLLYTGASQINLMVPMTVASESSSSMVVTVDGATVTQAVPVSPAWPAIFNPGVLNQDYSVNSPATPASAGSVLQIFLTGMPDNAPVTVIFGSQSGLTPLYAGAAPGISGVQQVNVAVPAGAGGGSTPVAVCATAGGRQFCATGLPAYVK
jgi:uncharacterized protein (TIGR03437 family)